MGDARLWRPPTGWLTGNDKNSIGIAQNPFTVKQGLMIHCLRRVTCTYRNIMPFSGRGTKIVEYLIAHTRAVTKGSTFLNFIKHFIDHLPWNLKVLVHHPWKREHCHFKSQYGRSIAALPPFLGTLINTLSHVLSHQPMQV